MMFQCVVAQQLESRTDDQEVLGSKPTGTILELLPFSLPHFALLEETLKAVGPFNLVSMRGGQKIPHRGKCILEDNYSEIKTGHNGLQIEREQYQNEERKKETLHLY